MTAKRAMDQWRGSSGHYAVIMAKVTKENIRICNLSYRDSGQDLRLLVAP